MSSGSVGYRSGQQWRGTGAVSIWVDKILIGCGYIYAVGSEYPSGDRVCYVITAAHVAEAIEDSASEAAIVFNVPSISCKFVVDGPDSVNMLIFRTKVRDSAGSGALLDEEVDASIVKLNCRALVAMDGQNPSISASASLPDAVIVCQDVPNAWLGRTTPLDVTRAVVWNLPSDVYDGGLVEDTVKLDADVSSTIFFQASCLITATRARWCAGVSILR